MNKLIKNLAIGMGSVAMASHLYAKTVTDHAGNVVEIPDDPKRVASLHTRSTSVMLTELGVPLIGSATVKHEADNRPYIRAAEELFGLVLQQTQLKNYGKKGADLEQIKISQPDLIVGTVNYHGKLYDKLSAIAPTVLIDQTGQDQIQVYKDLAKWVNKEKVFTAKYRAYKKRLALVKESFAKSPSKSSIVLAIPSTSKGKLSVYSTYGGITTVSYDLGFKMLPYVKENLDGQARERLSPEVISELDSDYFFSAYSSADDETPQDVYENFDKVTPGWKTILNSYKNKRFIVFHSETTRPPVFKAYHNALDRLEQLTQKQTKTVVDHLDNVVQIPKNPRRVASLHTMSTTVMLLDLQVSLVGTATRLKKPVNKPYIRSAEEIFGVKFEDTNYFNYGKFGEDIEQVKASKPDLIVGTVRHAKVYDKLSEIAPTVLIDYLSPDLFNVYRDLATWVGKKEVFEKNYAKYQKRLAEVKVKIKGNPSQQTFVYIHPQKGKGKLLVRQHYGAITKVAYDLGFQRLDFVRQQFPNNKPGGNLSAEVIGEFANADYIVSTYRNQFGETLDSIYEGLDDVSPGWRDFLKAYHTKRFIGFNREVGYPSSFVSYHYVLDEFERILK